MVEKLIRKPLDHASFGDWDLAPAYWQISNAQFVSSPSSINWVNPGTFTRGNQLCKIASALTLPEGRISSYLRAPSISEDVFHFVFRNTASPGNSNILNCYNVKVLGPQWWLLEYQNGVEIRSWIGTKEAVLNNTWYHYSVTWWLSWGIMMVKLEKEAAGVWAQQGNLVSVPSPLFGNEPYQRAGLGVTHTGASLYNVYFDDTEIWGVV